MQKIKLLHFFLFCLIVVSCNIFSDIPPSQNTKDEKQVEFLCKEGFYSIKYPPFWKKDETIQGNLHTLILKPPSENCEAWVMDILSQGITPKDFYYSLVSPYYEKYKENVQIEEPFRETDSGINWLYGKATIRLPDKMLIYKYFITEKNGRLYAIVLIAKTGQTEKELNDLNSIPQSFSFLSEGMAVKNQEQEPTIKNKDLKIKENIPRTVIYKLYIDKSVGAFWLLVPSDWKVSGGTVQQLFQPWRFNLSVEHPEGWGSFRFIPTPYYFTPNMFYGAGAMDERGDIYLPYMEPAQYLRQVIVPGLYGGSSNLKILEAKDLPSVAESYKNFCHLTETLAMGINMDVKAGELSLEIVQNGVTYFDRLVAIERAVNVTGSLVWESLLLQIRVRKDFINKIEPILMTSLSSFQINPNFISSATSAEIGRSEMRMRYQQEILAIQERMMKNRAKVNDEISRSISMGLGDQADFKDPQTGEVRTLTSSFTNTWTNGNGIFIQSNEPNLNPNDPSLQQSLGVNGNFREMKRK